MAVEASLPEPAKPPKEPKPCKGQAGFLLLGGALVMGGIWINELQDERRASREMEQFQRWYNSLPKCKEEAPDPPPGWKPRPIGAVGAAQEE